MRYALLTLILATTPALAQQDVVMKTQNVSGPVHMIEGNGGNIGASSGEDGLLIIDTQFANMAGKITDELAKLNKGPLKFIVNTHFHGDHTGGNQALAQNTPVVAHANVRTRMIGSRELTEAEFRNSLPTITYTSPTSLYINGETIELIPLGPGHTDGDTLVHFTKSNVYHTGDQFTNGMFPFIDLAGGGDVQGYLNNVVKMLEIIPADAKIIPGHGPLATRKDLETFQATLLDTIGIIRKGIADGKDQEALQKDGLPAKYDSWGKNFVGNQRWISIVYQSYTR